MDQLVVKTQQRVQPGSAPSDAKLHLDVLRDLRRIHSHICSVAYPVLDAAGELPAHRAAENDLITLPAGAFSGKVESGLP